VQKWTKYLYYLNKNRTSPFYKQKENQIIELIINKPANIANPATKQWTNRYPFPFEQRDTTSHYYMAKPMREMREASRIAQKPGTTISDPFSIAGAGDGAMLMNISSRAFATAESTTRVTKRSTKLFIIAIRELEKLRERDAKVD
jgi:hypothetical protein